MTFAFLAVPAGIVGFSKKIVDFTKWILGSISIHGFNDEELPSSLPTIAPHFLHAQGLYTYLYAETNVSLS
jgi:hypothetical protein